MRASVRALAAAGAAGALLLAACTTTPSAGGTSKGTSAASSNKSPITIAFVTSLTGGAAPNATRGAKAFKARIDLQNAKGGVDGHKLKAIVIDDASNFTQETATMQRAVETDGAFGVVSGTALMFAGYRWLQQNGIPVTGGSYDGPEWGERPNTNMFAADTGSITPNEPATSDLSKLLKLVGVKSVAALGYSISPESSQAAKNLVAAAEHVGIKGAYLNPGITYGAQNFTTQALAIKQSGAQLVEPSLTNAANINLVEALEQAGAHVKYLLPTGMQYTVIGGPAWTALQGAYFFQAFVPSQLHTPATKALQDALHKYQHIPTSQFPTWGVYEGWLGADLFIKGLQLDGPNPTRAGMIAKLRKLTKYNGGGLLPYNIDFATVFGHYPPKLCLYVLQAQKTGFVPVGKKPVCGTTIPGTGIKS